MTLKVAYSPLMRKRIKEAMDDIIAHAPEGRGRNALREQYSRAKYGLSVDYLRHAGGKHKRPSSRVLDNLGLEVWVRDPRTGETEKLELDYTCDWNPSQPGPRRLPASPSSTSASKSVPPE